MIPSETPHVCRQRLLDTLRENLKSCPATFISGRAGTGKTMLALDFVRRHEGRAAWYKVDAPDMSLPVFMEYLAASVAPVRPRFGRQTLDCHSRAFRSGETRVGGEFDIAALAEAFVYDLELQAEPLVLVAATPSQLRQAAPLDPGKPFQSGRRAADQPGRRAATAQAGEAWRTRSAPQELRWPARARPPLDRDGDRDGAPARRDRSPYARGRPL